MIPGTESFTDFQMALLAIPATLAVAAVCLAMYSIRLQRHRGVHRRPRNMPDVPTVPRHAHWTTEGRTRAINWRPGGTLPPLARAVNERMIDPEDARYPS